MIFITGKELKVVRGEKYYEGVEILKYFQDQRVEAYIYPHIDGNIRGEFKNTDFEIS